MLHQIEEPCSLGAHAGVIVPPSWIIKVRKPQVRPPQKDLLWNVGWTISFKIGTNTLANTGFCLHALVSSLCCYGLNVLLFIANHIHFFICDMYDALRWYAFCTEIQFKLLASYKTSWFIIESYKWIDQKLTHRIIILTFLCTPTMIGGWDRFLKCGCCHFQFRSYQKGSCLFVVKLLLCMSSYLKSTFLWFILLILINNIVQIFPFHTSKIFWIKKIMTK